jgi:hypothetical protein
MQVKAGFINEIQFLAKFKSCIVPIINSLLMQFDNRFVFPAAGKFSSFLHVNLHFWAKCLQYSCWVYINILGKKSRMILST